MPTPFVRRLDKAKMTKTKGRGTKELLYNADGQQDNHSSRAAGGEASC